jgi:hypothetical protein
MLSINFITRAEEAGVKAEAFSVGLPVKLELSAQI